MRLILVRHPQTDWNKAYRIQGQRDIPLNVFGEAQAEAIAQALAKESVEAIYSSPLSRAYQTSQAIGLFHQSEIIVDDRLKELDVGRVDGLYYPSLKTETPEFFNSWISDPAIARWPGGESLHELQCRVWEAVQNIISRDYGKTVVLTSHLFCLLTLLCSILELNLSNFRKLNLSVAGISVIEFAEVKTRLVSFNDTCHLKNGHI